MNSRYDRGRPGEQVSTIGEPAAGATEYSVTPSSAPTYPDAGSRAEVPPFLVFSKAAKLRDVVFAGAGRSWSLTPGSIVGSRRGLEGGIW